MGPPDTPATAAYPSRWLQNRAVISMGCATGAPPYTPSSGNGNVKRVPSERPASYSTGGAAGPVTSIASSLPVWAFSQRPARSFEFENEPMGGSASRLCPRMLCAQSDTVRRKRMSSRVAR